MVLDIGNLIDTVRSFPHLWDKKDPKYSDKIAIENAWETIGTIAEVSVEDCKTAWKNIRDRYIRERRLYTRRPSGSQPYTVRWPFYRMCNFLDSVIKQRKTIGNIKKYSEKGDDYCKELWQQELIVGEDGNLVDPIEDENEVNAEENESYLDESSNENNVLLEQEPADNVYSTPSTSRKAENPTSQKAENLENRQKLTALKIDRNEIRKQKRAKGFEVENLVEISIKVGESIQGLVQFIQGESAQNNSSIQEEDRQFCLSLAPSLSKIEDPKKKLKLKANILLLIAENE